MRYHNITHDDMLNGDGLRVVLWVSGCNHHCQNCQNPITWDHCVGLEFDESAEAEIFNELEKDYISGITLSGGDPLHENNVKCIHQLITKIRERFPNKSVWTYTGYVWEDIMNNHDSEDSEIHKYRQKVLSLSDIVVDGRFEQDKADINYHWAGSTNQKVINVKESLKNNIVILHK